MLIKLSFKDLEDKGYASVTDYCRELMKTDPEKYRNYDIEVYRGEMLCLTVKNVGWASTVEPTSEGWRKYTSKRRSNGRGLV